MWEAVGSVASGIGNYFAAKEQRKAAEAAAQAQQSAINRGLDFQQQNFNQGLGFQQQNFNQGLGFQQGLLGQAGALGQQQLGTLQDTFSPYLGAGQQAIGGLGQYAQAGLGGLQGQQALTGLLGANAQQDAIAGIQNSPQFAAMTKQGENALLQNASATGGLRGGNTQAALAQFRPQVLSQLIDQQYARLGGLAGQGAQSFGQLGQLGQFGAGGLASGGLDILRGQLGVQSQVGSNAANLSNQFGSNAGGLFAGLGNSVADLIGQQGQAQAGNALAQGKANAGMWSGIGNNISQQALLQQLHGWGGLGAQPQAAPAPDPSFSFGGTPALLDFQNRLFAGGLK